MKKVFASLLFLFAINVIAQEKPFTIPEVKGWEAAEGRIIPTGKIIYQDKEVLPVAEALAEDYKVMFGKQLTIEKGKPRPGDIHLVIEDLRALGEEGYQLDIDNIIVIKSGNLKGLYWGTRTMLQMCDNNAAHTLPKGHLTDRPEYSHRGFMIDCGRKYIPMSYLRNLVKIMGYYKMNVLQIHLNDNGFKQYFGDDWNKTQAAFRLECSTFPGLTAKDGSYTKQEFIDLQILAEKSGVEIIPEIDVPAHSLAFTQYKPEIASKEYGMDHLDLMNPKTYEFCDALFKEYCSGENPVFRGKKVCIGTDEYSNANKQVVEAFRSFTDHYIRLVESFGKTAVVWGALTHAKGETSVKSDGVIMNCWYNGYAQPKDMKEQGYQLVSIPDGWVYIVPAAGYYYDYLNCEHLYKNWTPAQIGNVKFDENDPAILGGMFAVWNDHAGNGISVKDIHHRVFPAMQTIAAKCWSGANNIVTYEKFNELRTSLSEGPGVNELATYGTDKKVVFKKDVVSPEETLDIEEIGYDYSVTFTVNGKTEEKGTILFKSNNAIFYLSDPKLGNLGFARDGYLNQFNYKLPANETHTITIQGNNKMTRLLVDGKQREQLNPLTLYAVKENNRFHQQIESMNSYEPEVYDLKTKMYYQRTLVFPLRKVGKFNSTITDLVVENYIR